MCWVPYPPNTNPNEPTISDLPEINFIIDQPKNPRFFIQIVMSIHKSTKFSFNVGVDEDDLFFAPYEEYRDICVLNGFNYYSEDAYITFFDALNEWCTLNSITMSGLNLFC